MALTLLDYGLLGLAGVLALVGLFRGISGEVGRAAGLAAGFCAGLTGHGACCALAARLPGLSDRAAVAGAVFAVAGAFFVFYATMKIVDKFVSVVVPQPFNAVFGALAGAAKGAVVVALLAITGVLFGEKCAQGPLAGWSELVRAAGALLDVYAGNAAP